MLLRGGRLAEAEPYLRAAREQAPSIALNWIAPTSLSLSLVLARSGQVEEARRWLDDALAALAPLRRPALAIEARAISARLRDGLADEKGALEDAEIAADLAERFEVNHFSDKAWHLAAAHALLGDDAKAMHFAQAAARSFVDDALSMGARAGRGICPDALAPSLALPPNPRTVFAIVEHFRNARGLA